MSFPRYPAYKDSGVEWLGEVPEHWEVLPLKREFAVVGGSTPKSDMQTCWDGDIQWITPADLSRLQSFEITESIRTITAEGLNSCGATMVPIGSVVVSTRAPIGSLGIAAIDLCTNQGCKALVPINQISSKFIAYFLGIATEALNIRGRGATFLEISGDELGAFKATLPPCKEQVQIATFLDRETAKIDALIAEQQRLIELLQEKRQAVISHAVTKGLNPDAPMKDSGVEWLGEVPVHWLIKPIKYLVSKASGGTPAKDNLAYWQDGDVPWASSKDLKTDEIDDTQDHLTQLAISEGAAQLQPVDSVFICVRGMILAHTFPVTEPLREMAINQDLKCLVPTKEISSGYLALCLRGLSAEILRRVDEAAHGTKVLRIPDFDSVLLPVPPLEAQTQILSAIAHSLDHLDSLISQASRSMALLSERRSALISAAVTGQIDVRGLVPEVSAA